jgi:chromosome segregation ATPase
LKQSQKEKYKDEEWKKAHIEKVKKRQNEIKAKAIMYDEIKAKLEKYEQMEEDMKRYEELKKEMETFEEMRQKLRSVIQSTGITV